MSKSGKFTAEEFELFLCLKTVKIGLPLCVESLLEMSFLEMRMPISLHKV